MSSLKSIRLLYKVTGIYGVLVLIPHYFLEARIGADFPPPITHPEFFYGFVGAALAWQLVFLTIAKDPVRFRPIMLGAILEKISFGIATVSLFALQRASAMVALSGMLDLFMGAAFVWAFLRTPKQ
jgi:hypothetical protein